MGEPMLVRTIEPASFGENPVFQQQLAEQSMFIAALYGAVFVVGFLLLAGFTWRIQRRPLDWSGPLARLAARPWTLRDVAAVALPLIGLQLAFAAGYWLYERGGGAQDDHVERALLVLQGLLFHWAGFGLIAWYLRRRNLSWTEAFGDTKTSWARHLAWGLGIMVGVMPVLIAYNLALQVVMNWLGYPLEVQDVTRVISGATGWLARIYFGVLALVIAPIVEELLFRGMLLPALTRVMGIRPALIAVALLFSVVHGWYLPSAVVFFMLSLSFSLAYIYRGSILTPIAMHALFNGLTIVIIYRL